MISFCHFISRMPPYNNMPSYSQYQHGNSYPRAQPYNMPNNRYLTPPAYNYYFGQQQHRYERPPVPYHQRLPVRSFCLFLYI